MPGIHVQVSVGPNHLAIALSDHNPPTYRSERQQFVVDRVEWEPRLGQLLIQIDQCPMVCALKSADERDISHSIDGLPIHQTRLVQLVDLGFPTDSWLASLCS